MYNEKRTRHIFIDQPNKRRQTSDETLIEPSTSECEGNHALSHH